VPQLRRQSGAPTDTYCSSVVSELRYSVYMLRCADGSLYTGIATDVTRRIAEHESSTRGAKYLRGRGPLELAYAAEVGNRGVASKIEHRLKSLAKVDKEALVAGQISLADVADPDSLGQASGSDGG